MQIRTYRPDDLAAIHTVNQAEVPAVGTETLEALGAIAAMSSIPLVAEVDSEVAGFALVLTVGTKYQSLNYRWFSERYDDFVYLDRVAISPNFQRRGIGRSLYTEIEKQAADRHPTASEFALEVNLEPRNDQSLTFHSQLGFSEVGQRRGADGKLVSLMTKPL